MSLARPMASIALRPKLLTPSWMILLAWLYSVMQFTPTFYFTDVKPITVEKNKTVYYCTTVPNNSLSGLAYLMFLAVASFVLPLVTMSIMYYKVSRVVWRRQRNLSISSTISANTAHLSVLIQSRRRVIRVLLTVVLVFLICWSPFVIYCGFLEKTLRGFPNPMDGTRLALYSLGLLNSMCNPFIYFFNVGGKRNDALKDLYLQIYSENKSRRSSTNSQGGERKSSRKLQQFRLKTMDRENSVKNKLEKNSEKNRNKLTDFQIRESMEELWQPFSVWPPIGDLRESVL